MLGLDFFSIYSTCASLCHIVIGPHDLDVFIYAPNYMSFGDNVPHVVGS